MLDAIAMARAGRLSTNMVVGPCWGKPMASSRWRYLSMSLAVGVRP